MNTPLHIVVMAGGSGTRFWPVSRKTHPKQLLALGGERTLLAQTFARVEPLVPSTRWWMVVGAAHAAECAAAVPEVSRARVLVEPVARNTAAAIALAALHVERADPDAVMVVLPADHFVAKPEALRGALERAAVLARDGEIVTLGITPTHPETGYGYIERGAADARVSGAFRVQRFCEKPTRERALEFLASGRFDWNAGMFVLSPRTFWREAQASMPELVAAMRRLGAALDGPEAAGVSAREYAALASVSVDYGIMEKAQRICVVPVECGWSDIGSWSALPSVVPPDASGNVTQGRAVLVDTRGSVVYAEPGHVVGVVGLNDVVVVHTKDATLVVPVARAQDVRSVIEGLQARGWSEYL